VIRLALCTLSLMTIVSSCSTGSLRTAVPPRPAVRIDHVIVGASNLEAAVRELEKLTGVRAAIGGNHPGKGTRNALLSLGDGTYLELYAPNPTENVRSADVAELESLTRLTPLGWAVGTTDVDGLRSYFASQGMPLSLPEPGSRVRPDGSVLEWATFGFEQLDHSLAPFFIHWKRPELHPSRTSPSGCRLLSLRLRDPAPTELQRAVRILELSGPVERAFGKQMELQLSCPRGQISLK
jgi:hypothetical protein